MARPWRIEFDGALYHVLSRGNGREDICADKDNRDILLLSVWKTGMMTNDEIGSIFGMTYSSVSHIVKTIRIRMKEEHNLKERFNRIINPAI